MPLSSRARLLGQQAMRRLLKPAIFLLAIAFLGFLGDRLHAPALFEIITLNLRYYLLHQLRERPDLQLKYLLRYEQLTQTNLPDTQYYARIAPNLLGDLYVELGQTDDALKEYQKGLELARRAFGNSDMAVAANLTRIGSTYFQRSEYETAAEYFTASVNMKDEIEQKKGLPSTTKPERTLIAFCWLYTGRLQEAASLFKSIQSDSQDEHETKPSNLKQRAVALQNAATAAMMKDNWDEAIARELEALKLYQQAVGPRSLGVTDFKQVLASLYSRLNRLDDAEREVREVIDIQTEWLGSENLALSSSHSLLGSIEEKRARTSEAIDEFQVALQIQKARLPARSTQIGETHVNIGRNYRALKNWTAAYQHLNEASKIFAADYASFGTGQGSEAQLRLQAYDGLLQAASELQKEGGADLQTLTRDTLRAAQAAARSAAADAIVSTSARLEANDPKLSAQVRHFEEISIRYQLLATRVLSGADGVQGTSSSPSDLRASLDELIKQKDALRDQIAAEFPSYFNLVTPTPLELDEIKDLLQPDEVLIIFRSSNETTYIWTVSKYGSATWIDLSVSPTEIGRQVNELLAALRNPFSAYKSSSSRFSLRTAFSLYRLLFSQVDQAFGTKRLLIVPSGSLASIPLHVLVTSEPPPEAEISPNYDPTFYQAAQWLAVQHSLVTLPAVQSLKAFRTNFTKASDAPQPYIGFGDPVLPVTDLPSLPNAAVEVKEAARIFGAPSSAVRLGRDASESTIKSLVLSDYKVLHVATHALDSAATLTFDGQNEPSLVLAKDDYNDGFLTASEVAVLKLNANWVILSACNTASEGNQGGGALSGLARAFLYAGARSLLVSHWVVEDAAASMLIAKIVETQFSEKESSIADGLRVAMKSLIADPAHGEYAYPSNWAPFVVVGSPARYSH